MCCPEYYLFKGLAKRPDQTFPFFLKSKVIRLYPTYLLCYLVGLTVAIAADSVPKIVGVSSPFCYAYIGVDLLMMQNWGFGLPTLGDWYISALFLGMIILFFVWKMLPRRQLVFALLGIVVSFSTVILVMQGNLNVHEPRHHISSGVIRGLIGLCVGGAAFGLSEKISIKYPKWLFFAASSALFLMMFLYRRTALDFLTLPLAFLLALSGIRIRVGETSEAVGKAMGGISFEIYLVHSSMREILQMIGEEYCLSILCNIALSGALAVVIHFLADRISGAMLKKKTLA